MQSFYIWYQTSMNTHQRNISTNQANSSFKDNRRFLSKWNLFLFCSWLQWLQLPWKNVRLDIFSLRSTTVSIAYFLTYNVMMNQWILMTSLIKVLVNSIFSLIAPTPRECCEAAGVPEFCLGLCSPVDATARQENRINACSKYDATIENCFQSAESKNQGE